MKLLITSVGSFLGQNILDLIEPRRHQIEVVGLNLDADNPRLFRCDRSYLVPKTEDESYESVFKEIITLENPDITLPGRDGDCIFLADFRVKYPEIGEHSIFMGTSYIPKIMLNKYDSFKFCSYHGLPFADSFFYENKKSDEDLEVFVSKQGFPLVAKPVEGFGSHGVYYVMSNKNLDQLKSNGHFLIQEFLGDPTDLYNYNNTFKFGLPLFFQVPEKKQFAAQTLIDSDGRVQEVCVTLNHMIQGRAEYIESFDSKEIVELVTKYAKVFYEAGWFGPTNFQLKQDKYGQWKVFELNSRLTGTSSARRYLGFDEFEKIINCFKPDLKLTKINFGSADVHVYKYLTDYCVHENDISNLEKNRTWKRS
jgi:carbamoyl-phosphate synthase large subunit